MFRIAAIFLFLAVVAAPAAAADWVTAWSRPQGIPVSAAADVLNSGRVPAPLVNQSVRNIVRVTGGGTALRIRLSNRYGSSLLPSGTLPLRVSATTIAIRSADADVAAETLREVTFGGQREVTIAAGNTAISDAVMLPVAAGTDLAVSLHVGLSDLAPQHGASFVTSYVSPIGSGDHIGDISGAAYTQVTSATMILTGVDVLSGELRGAIAATGGSVVDGFGSDIDGYNDFPSWLSLRIRGEFPAASQKTVINDGMGGSTAATICATPVSGPSVEARVQHDSLEQVAGLTHLIVYAGTNDLGNFCTANAIIAAYRSTIGQAQAKGVRVLISTITPRGSYTALQNAQREKVNAWVRGGGNCSGECWKSLDFDAVIKDPGDPNRIAPALDSGDGIHPTGEGYRLIAASVPLEALVDKAGAQGDDGATGGALDPASLLVLMLSAWVAARDRREIGPGINGV